MASSSSSSSSSSSWEHDVFLCFRGEDTREGFTGHLYQALSVHCGINTFMDDRLPKGREISELLERIERSRISIVIFSPNFASSRWCLDELAKIIECKDRDAGQEVLPVFYKVAPTELRGPKGKMAEHLAKLSGRDAEMLSRWRLALEEFSNLRGWTFMQGVESGLIAQIVDEVRSRVDHVSLDLRVDDHDDEKDSLQVTKHATDGAEHACTKVVDAISTVFALCILALHIVLLVAVIKAFIEGDA
ncbi:TMV resistance protein N-like [Punica granatum]|uniref:TMV resistance protein N-like n=2 Tax=Punica granatum TaxID=22663 RepID=A0A6P8EGN1_PUNGR|nr:TMV resistance protein N-like [Punica granatum]PKI51189.1 hypothetical protein CRG98_028476 [Punica granatum]